MKNLYLTSSVNFVASHIAQKINRNGLKLVFITTPVEPDEEQKDLGWFYDDRNALVGTGFHVTDYTITGKSLDNIEKTLRETDIIYISGGNTFYLLEKIQEAGCADILKKIVEEGKIYIGTSAGSIVAGTDIYPTYRIDNIASAPNLKGYKGLSLVDFVILPHWGSVEFKELYLNYRLEHTYNTDSKIILLTNYQYVEVNDRCYRIVDVNLDK